MGTVFVLIISGAFTGSASVLRNSAPSIVYFVGGVSSPLMMVVMVPVMAGGWRGAIAGGMMMSLM